MLPAAGTILQRKKIKLMKKRLIMAIMCFMCVATTSLAQNNSIQLGFGFQRTWVLDQQGSPLKYQTKEKTLSLGYKHYGENSKLDIQLNGALGDFFPTGFFGRHLYDPGYNEDGTHKTDSSLMNGKIYNGRIKIGYMRAVSNGYSVIDKKQFYGKNYVGASLNNQLFYTDNFTRTGWMNSSSFNGEFEHRSLFNTKHSFEVKVSIPLFALVSRLPYHNSISSSNGDSDIKTFFKQGSRFAWLGNFQNIQLDAGYQYMLSKSFGLGMHYFGQWLHYTREKPVNLFQNQLALTASLNY